ncbi:MAG: FMN-binding negative transcriptional regulator [Pseudomonadota bacterium]
MTEVEVFVPEEFASTDPSEAVRIATENPLATLVTATPDGPTATHVPVILTIEDRRITRIACHVARANPHWRKINEQSRILVIFQGTQHYVTPGWYPSKQDSGRVVPTWNFEAVHIEGTARTISDAGWLGAHVAEVSDRFEYGRPQPWKTGDAPESYMQALVRGIVGIEITPECITTKVKASQNKSDADRQGVIDGLRTEADASARKMAELVERMVEQDGR